MVNKKTNGFTLIELLVVISIIGLLSTLAIVAFQNARKKGRDAVRKGDMDQLAKSLEIRFNDLRNYPTSVASGDMSGLEAVLVPAYIPRVPTDPLSVAGYDYLYFRKDLPPTGCPVGDMLGYAFYTRLESPTAADLASIKDSFDTCIRTNFSINYRNGND